MKSFVMEGFKTPSGVSTATGVKELQRKLGVAADGVWGPKTQGAYDKFLVSKMADNNLPASYDPEKTAYAKDIYGLSIGVGKSDTGSHVMQGFSTPSGIVTPEAVKSVQAELGIHTDGIWGPRTDAAYKAYKAKEIPYAEGYPEERKPRKQGSFITLDMPENQKSDGATIGYLSGGNTNSRQYGNMSAVPKVVDPSLLETEDTLENNQRLQEGISEIETSYKDIKADAVPWNTLLAMEWKQTEPFFGDLFIVGFKNQWISGNRNLITAAAQKYDIPVELLAGVAWTEVGGDPAWFDTVAYPIRKAVSEILPKQYQGKIWPDVTKDPQKTSFGDLSMQIRVAAETLGIPASQLNTDMEKEIIHALQDPGFSIFIAAKHLSDLKRIDFANIPSGKLTIDDIATIASRYNIGAGASYERAARYSYGKAIKKHLPDIMKYILPN